MIGSFVDLFRQPIFTEIIALIKHLWFLWLPALAGYLFYETWLGQKRLEYLKGCEWVLLEMKIPREIMKSPKAMETILNSLHTTYAGNWRKRYLFGFLPIWYSLEIVGINGRVSFFIYAQKPFRNLVESQIYAHYPEVEISEASDYATAGNFENLNEWDLWGVEFGLSKPDAYPIKTYVDHGLHELLAKEEQKVNPLVSFLEFLGSLKQGEQVWFQVLIRGAGIKWVEESRKVIDELMGRKKEAAGEGEEKAPHLSKGEQEVVAAIERSISKLGFETGIRAIYLAKKEFFNSVNNAGIIGVMNQYSAQNLNSLKRKWRTDDLLFDFILQTKRENRKKIKVLSAYRLRSYFYAPHKRKSFVFNGEELATLYHFPGRVAETPTFGRIEAKKSEPPANLPI